MYYKMNLHFNTKFNKKKYSTNTFSKLNPRGIEIISEKPKILHYKLENFHQIFENKILEFYNLFQMRFFEVFIENVFQIFSHFLL